MAKRILVVDDEPDITEMVALRLAAGGYEVVTASSGKECLDKAVADNFALIIMDVSMPEMDGIAAACRLQRDKATRDIPVIFLTALATKEDLGADHAVLGRHIVIAKPFDGNDLLMVVKQQIKA
jgi:CheY-like chemotaxis protein